MGVSILLAAWMLFVFASPFLYFILFVLSFRAANKIKTIRKRIIGMLAIVIIFSLIPTHLFSEYLRFSKSCETQLAPITTTPIEDIESIAFVTENGDSIHKPFFWHQSMNLNIKEYEYAYLVNGKETSFHHCDGITHKCKNSDRITSQYMFLVTAAKKNSNGVLQSTISVVDRLSGKTLYETQEFVLSGILAAYHGAFIAKKNHRGYLSCGYLGSNIDVWRPNDSNQSRRHYIETDTKLLTSLFPTLKNN